MEEKKSRVLMKHYIFKANIVNIKKFHNGCYSKRPNQGQAKQKFCGAQDCTGLMSTEDDQSTERSQCPKETVAATIISLEAFVEYNSDKKKSIVKLLELGRELLPHPSYSS